MIELTTGVPGSGKTLSRVELLSKLVARWELHPDEARPIFVSGVPDLAIPHAEMPLKSVQINKAGSPSLVPDWDAMPDGSLVFIDEAQGVFPPRSSASTVPAHVAWLNTHRHKGFDIWLSTQHPKLIDGTVRALVGKHQHYRRLFGGMRAAVYEWDCCSDNLSGTKSAVVSYWSYPRSAFKWYKSAEIHTKQRFKLPRWLLIPVLGLVLMLVFFPKAYSVMFGDHKPSSHPVPASVAHEVPLPGQIPLAASAVVATGQGVTDRQSTPDFSKPFEQGQPPADRPVSQLKVAANVYTDDPSISPHYTEAEIQNQERNSRILDNHDQERIYNQRLAAYEADERAPIVFVDPLTMRKHPLRF